MSFVTNPIVVGTALGIPSFVLAVAGLRLGLHRDRVAEQAGIATGRAAEVNLIIASQNAYIDQLQEDRQSLRDEAKHAAQRLLACSLESEEREKSLRRFRRKYGDNGDNGAMVTEPTPPR